MLRFGLQIYWCARSVLEWTGPVFTAVPVCTSGWWCVSRDRHTSCRPQCHTAFMGQIDQYVYAHTYRDVTDLCVITYIFICSMYLINMVRKWTKRIMDNADQNSFLTTGKKCKNLQIFISLVIYVWSLYESSHGFPATGRIQPAQFQLDLPLAMCLLVLIWALTHVKGAMLSRAEFGALKSIRNPILCPAILKSLATLVFLQPREPHLPQRVFQIP